MSADEATGAAAASGIDRIAFGLALVPDVIAAGEIVPLAADADVEAAARRLADEGLAALPVVDAAGCLIGLLGAADIVRAVVVAGRCAATLAVAEAMTPVGDALAPDDAPLDALELLALRGTTALPVMAAGQCVGVVSHRELAAALLAAVHRELRVLQERIFNLPPEATCR